MKFLISLILSLSNFYFLFAQPSIQWQKCFGGTSHDAAYDIKQTKDSGYIITGTSSSIDGDATVSHNSVDYWILKTDNTGNIQWQKSYGGSDIDIAKSIQITPDGGYIIAGYSNSNDGDVIGNHGSGSSDIWVLKLNDSGVLQWQKTLGGSGFEDAKSIQLTSDGGYIIAGQTNFNGGDVSGNNGWIDYWIVKLDSLGIIQWQKALGGSEDDYGYDIKQTKDDGYIVVGSSLSKDGDITSHHNNPDFLKYDYWIVKLDPLGVIEWEKSLGGSEDDIATSILQVADGSFVVAGVSSSNDGDVTGSIGWGDYWIVNLDSIGNIQWQNTLGGDLKDDATSISQTLDSGFIVAGNSYSSFSDSHGNLDFLIYKLDKIGDLQWQKCIGGSRYDEGHSIQQTKDYGFIVAGRTNSNDGDITGQHGPVTVWDFWVVKLSPFIVNLNEIQKSFINFKIVPNPFSNETIIKFNQSSSIKIYDTNGRIIKNLNTNNLIGDENEIVWNASDDSGNKIGSGIYFITFISDNICVTKKVVVY